jgi:hypothetical protein
MLIEDGIKSPWSACGIKSEMTEYHQGIKERKYQKHD